MSGLSDADVVRLRAEYEILAAVGGRLLASLKEQVAIVVDQNDIALAVPIEIRIKTWESIREKIQRRTSPIKYIAEITDIAGMRLITLFQSDIEKLDKLLRSMLQITEAEDTSSRLDDAEFGYRSNHYIGRIPQAWLNIPSFNGLGDICTEIQVRTLPQHMWAAASHRLQYKHEDSAPPRLRRAINRVSAILETVDLEFTRMLEERELYVTEQNAGTSADALLNVDNVAALLAEIFPSDNRGELESYDELLRQLKILDIEKIGQLRRVLEKGKAAALDSDKSRVKTEVSESLDGGNPLSSRLERGVYFQHVGLAREAIRAAHGPLPGDTGFIGKSLRRKPLKVPAKSN